MLLEPERVSERLKATGTQLTILNRELNMNELIDYINKLNEETRKSGAVGFLINDLEHWASYGIYTVGDFQLYLDREYEHNMCY